MSHRVSAALVLCGLLAVPTFAQQPAPPSPALLQDAAWYAEQFKVSLDEAVRRLSLQSEIGRLDETLTAEEPSFGGLWIEHRPQYRLVIRFKDPSAAGRLSARIAGTALEKLPRATLPAAASLSELEKQHAAARQHVTRLGFTVDSDINVQENRVEIYSERAPALRVALAQEPGGALAGRVEVVAVSELAKPAVLRGGDGDQGWCSGGFTVRNSDASVVGITTAGHCGNTQLFQGMALPLVEEYFYSAGDIQWHSACGYTDVTNEFNSGLGYRPCTGQRLRSQQGIGTLVCHFGNATGRACGIIRSKSYNPSYIPGNGDDKFIRVDGNGRTISAPGDSGAPWFFEDLAYGIHSGTFNDRDAIYMAVDYIAWVGAAVLTYDPGPGCHVRPVASFTYTVSGTTLNFNASASYDGDGSIVSYFWNFGDGTTGTGVAPSHGFPYQGWFPVTLTVTDNTGRTGVLAFDVFAGTFVDPCMGDPCCGDACCRSGRCQPLRVPASFDGNTGRSNPEKTKPQGR